jgi:glycosyltransferase EpsJ
MRSIETQADNLSVELIVVFDGRPEDKLTEIVEEVSNRIRCKVLICPERGVSATRNTGMDEATGTWVSFVDADDCLPENALCTLVEYGEKNGCDIVMGCHISLLGKMSEKHEYLQNNMVMRGQDVAKFRHDVLSPQTNAGLVWGKIYKKELLETFQIRFNEKLAMAEDSDFVFRFVGYAHVLGFCHKDVYVYRRNANSAVRAFRSDYVTRIEASMEAMREQIDGIPDKETYDSAFQSYVAFHLLLILVNYIFNPKAPWTDKERQVEYDTILDKSVFDECLHKVKIKDFSLTRKISLLSLKYRVYWLSQLIGYFRQRQFG